jgi:steroid delta-isomerase-like uncharacterized protein
MRTKVIVLGLAAVFLVSLVAFGQAQTPKVDMKKVAEKIVKATNSGDPVAITNIYAPDAVMVQPDTAEPVRGRDALLKYYTAALKCMPDMKVNWSLIAYHGDTIIFEGVWTGTFTGPMETPEGVIQPNGNKVNLKAAFFAKINADGLIAEDRTYFDNYVYMKQLGLIK